MRIIVQHQRLLESLAELEELSEYDEDAGAEWRTGCRLLLGAFIERLREHFADELATTSAEQVDAKAADLMRRLRQLDAEHPALLATFEDVLNSFSDPNIPAPILRGAVARAAKAFREHEAKENDLFFELT